MTEETIYVGDPIDVITGNQFDVALDFQIAWSFPFEWRRLYSVARCREPLALGWGHTHSYDHRLSYNLDGLLYVDPRGHQYQFRVPRADAPVSQAPGGTLLQIARNIYRVRTRRQPECDFQFVDVEQPARLIRTYLGRAFHALGYDASGAWTSLTYGNEPPVRIESSGGRLDALIWTGQPGGRERPLWRGEYDRVGNLVAVTDVRGTQRFEYDPARRMVRHVDRVGYAFLMTYDEAGRCIRSSGEDGVQDVRLQFRPDEKRTLMTRADDGEWQYLYDRAGMTGVLDPYGGITRRVYGEGGLVEEIGPSGDTLRKLVDPESDFLASPFGPPTGPALPFGDPWFDPLTTRVTASDPLGWDGFGTFIRRASITLPAYHADRRWPVRLPARVVDSLTFGTGPVDAGHPMGAGRDGVPPPKKPMFRPAPAGNLQYDSFGILTGHEQPNGRRCRWQYDANGNVVRHVDYEGSEWQSKYASWNHCIAQVDPLGHATSFEYNKLEKLVGISDPAGTRTEYRLDLKDRMIGRARDGQPRDSFVYDLSDRLVQAGDGGGEVRVQFDRGPHGRPIRVAPEGGPVREYEYDERGRLLSVTAAGKPMLRFDYDQVGAVTADVQHGLSVQRQFAALRLVEMRILERFAIKYERDRERNIVTITDPTGRRHSVRRLDLGVFLLERCNGVREVSQYDWNGRCLARSRFSGFESFTNWSRTYLYSGVGALLEATNSHGSTLTYHYDPAHRLVAVNGPRGSLGRFSMDEAGNVRAAPGLDHAAVERNRLVTANGREILYDDRGNMIEDRSGPWIARYTYDAEDRLIACDAGGEHVAFSYDALGRRLTKTASAGTTTFIWDGERLAAEEFPNGDLRIYVYADEKAMTPFLFVDYDSKESDPAEGRLRHLFTDQISCPVLVEDQEARTLWRARIAPYGAQTVSGRSRLTFNLRWPGHYFDIETGLHYNRHRYYNPRLCRYTQPDPLDIDGGLNVYAYPPRPLDTVDVDGLYACPKKAMIQDHPPEKEEEYQAAKKQAEEVALALRAALKEANKIYSEDPTDPDGAHWGVTLATMVVVDRDGNYQVVLTGNKNPAYLPEDVQAAAGGLPVIGWDDGTRPAPVRQSDGSWRYSRTGPDGEEDPTTHTHAEQRGLRSVDCAKDPDGKDSYQGAAFIAPTRPCCQGCSNAIQTSHSGDGNSGGWGGTSQNVSDLGRAPDRNGVSHWDD